jgi:hypothetical protein
MGSTETPLSGADPGIQVSGGVRLYLRRGVWGLSFRDFISIETCFPRVILNGVKLIKFPKFDSFWTEI